MPRCCVGLLGYKSGPCQARVYTPLLRTRAGTSGSALRRARAAGEISDQRGAAVQGFESLPTAGTDDQ